MNTMKCYINILYQYVSQFQPISSPPYFRVHYLRVLALVDPTDDFFQSYSTANPRNAAIASLAILFVVSILFILYDFYVRREFTERRQLLEAKRRFIRYVSHEVRTPLNAVIMGLNIFESELQSDESHPERLGLLQEVQTSANAAVDCLNDVLQYDKIE